MRRTPRPRRHRTGHRDVVRIFTRAVIATPVVAGLALAVWLLFIAAPPSQRMLERFRVKTGGSVPYVQLRDRLGASTTLGALTAGQPTLVVLSDADCTHCENQVRMLKTLRGDDAPARLLSVSVSVPGRYPAMVNRYAPIPLYDDVNGAFRGKLGLKVVPAVVSVGADGRVRDIRFGQQSAAQLWAMMRAAAEPARLSSTGGSGTGG